MESKIKLFGQKIKEFRKKRRLTQEQLAEIIDVDYQTISRIETGYYFTSFENLTKLADALNVEIKDFFDFKTDENTEKIQDELSECIKKMSAEKLKKLSKFIKEFL